MILRCFAGAVRHAGLVALLLSVVVTILVACGSSSRPGTVDRRELVVFTRTGGLAGGSLRLIVTRNGVARLTQGGGVERTRQLSTHDLDSLRQALQQATFTALQPRYRNSRQAYDAFTYTITYSDRTVEAEDGSMPAALANVVMQLNGVVAMMGRSG